MSRESATYDMISNLKTMLMGDIKIPELFLIPSLTEIAISLAVIADCLTEDGRRGEQDG